MLGRQVAGSHRSSSTAGSSAQCVRGVEARQATTHGRQMARWRPSGEYHPAPWCCKDVKVSNDVTPFGSSRQCYSFVVADKFTPLLYR